MPDLSELLDIEARLAALESQFNSGPAQQLRPSVYERATQTPVVSNLEVLTVIPAAQGSEVVLTWIDSRDPRVVEYKIWAQEGDDKAERQLVSTVRSSPAIFTYPIDVTGPVIFTVTSSYNDTETNFAESPTTVDIVTKPSILAGDLADGSVGDVKLDRVTDAITILTADIASAQITTALIADAQITSAKIVTLVASKISAGTLAASVILASNINATQINAGTLDVGVLLASNIAATQITAGTLDVGVLLASNIAATQITAGTLDVGVILASNIAATQITAGTLDVGVLLASNIAATQITAGTLNVGVLLISNIAATQINAGTITAVNVVGGTYSLVSGVQEMTIDGDDGFMQFDSSGDFRTVLKFGEIDQYAGSVSASNLTAQIVTSIENGQDAGHLFLSRKVGNQQHILGWTSLGEPLYTCGEIQMHGTPTAASFQLGNGVPPGLITLRESAGNDGEIIVAEEFGTKTTTILGSVTTLSFVHLLSEAAPAGTAGLGKLWFDSTANKLQGKDGTGSVYNLDNSIGVPGGAEGNIQYFASGTFGGDAQFNWNEVSNILTVTGTAIVTGSAIDAVKASTGGVQVEKALYLKTLASSPTNPAAGYGAWSHESGDTYRYWDGSAWNSIDLSVSGGTPGGADTQVQFNNSGAFGGDAQFTWDLVNNKLIITGTADQAAISVTEGFIESNDGFTTSSVASNAIQAPSGGLSANVISATATAINAIDASSGGVTAKFIVQTVFSDWDETDSATAGTPAAGTSRIYMDSTSKTLKISQNGGSYLDLGAPAGTGDMVQYNDGAGRFAGEAAFTYNPSTNVLAVDDIVSGSIKTTNSFELFDDSGEGSLKLYDSSNTLTTILTTTGIGPAMQMTNTSSVVLLDIREDSVSGTKGEIKAYDGTDFARLLGSSIEIADSGVIKASLTLDTFTQDAIFTIGAVGSPIVRIRENSSGKGEIQLRGGSVNNQVALLGAGNTSEEIIVLRNDTGTLRVKLGFRNTGTDGQVYCDGVVDCYIRSGSTATAGLYIGGNQIISQRLASIASPSADVTSLKTAVDAIRARLGTSGHGLIS